MFSVKSPARVYSGWVRNWIVPLVSPTGRLTLKKPCAGDREVQRVVGLGDRALDRVDVVGPGDHRAGLVHRRVAGGQVVLEVGVDPLVADGLAVGDIVADIAERARLGRQTTDGGVHRTEKGHGWAPVNCCCGSASFVPAPSPRFHCVCIPSDPAGFAGPTSCAGQFLPADGRSARPAPLSAAISALARRLPCPPRCQPRPPPRPAPPPARPAPDRAPRPPRRPPAIRERRRLRRTTERGAGHRPRPAPAPPTAGSGASTTAGRSAPSADAPARHPSPARIATTRRQLGRVRAAPGRDGTPAGSRGKRQPGARRRSGRFRPHPGGHCASRRLRGRANRGPGPSAFAPAQSGRRRCRPCRRHRRHAVERGR